MEKFILKVIHRTEGEAYTDWNIAGYDKDTLLRKNKDFLCTIEESLEDYIFVLGVVTPAPVAVA